MPRIKIFTAGISYYMCYGNVCIIVVDVRKFIYNNRTYALIFTHADFFGKNVSNKK